VHPLAEIRLQRFVGLEAVRALELAYPRAAVPVLAIYFIAAGVEILVRNSAASRR